MIFRFWILLFGFCLVSSAHAETTSVDSTKKLVAAVAEAKDGDIIKLAPGTYRLESQLQIKSSITLTGAGIDQTILTHTDQWIASPSSLPDPEMTVNGLDRSAYLIRLNDRVAKITISHLTLQTPQLHGAIFGWDNDQLHLHDLKLQTTMWSGIRTFSMRRAKIHDCQFIDAGGRWKKGGLPGKDGGITGGGIFAIWMSDCELFNNRFQRTRTAKEHEFYGIKVRQAKRCRFHHNTIEVNFSLELPFENDEDNEIDHNVCFGTISIPKHAGGSVPKSGQTFHIHHNWMKDSYSIEFVRNGVEIDHNLFDFDVAKDHGNLISGFGKVAAKGPAKFHHNLVSNPGRGVIWINEVYNHLEIYNNHIITRTTTTPRKEGLFGFNPGCDFKTISIRDNLIECEGQSRPLLRAKESYAAKIENNTLKNLSDTDRYPNPKADRSIGLDQSLQFQCGVNGEFSVDGWKVAPSKKK